MIYSKEFFALQIDFARTVAKLARLPLDRALLDYTNLYIRFGLGRDFSHAHPTWRRYIEGLVRADDLYDWTYRFYVAQGEDSRPAAASGCFSHVIQNAECVRIHFRNVKGSVASPLGAEQLHARLAELRSIFEHVKRNTPGATRVVGTSWLYNLPAYQRCFPDSYVASAQLTSPRFRHVSLWGQFLDRSGMLRRNGVHEFESALAGISDTRDLHLAFPLQALAVEAPISDFYRFYAITDD